MPVITRSTYRAPFFLRNGHVQTILPTFIRKLDASFYRRERIGTPDGDFLDLDWSVIGSDNLAVLSHGLEGDSHRHYIVGMVTMLNRHGWDAVAWNYRGCSGETNRRLRMYHNGSIDDLDSVLHHVLVKGRYRTIALIGFSLGGNLTLLYLGKNGMTIDSRIGKAVVFSVPCDLAAGARELAKPKNRLYMEQFLISLHKKIRAKMAIMPDAINDDHYGQIRNFKDFDDRYTAPIHGFLNAEDYWSQCSSSRFISRIRIPTLLVNALDDPFLGGGCYPKEDASKSSRVYLEMPDSGGHVGFMQLTAEGSYWSEIRTMEFLEE